MQPLNKREISTIAKGYKKVIISGMIGEPKHFEYIGYNAGTYGINWRAYEDKKTGALWIQALRNIPNIKGAKFITTQEAYNLVLKKKTKTEAPNQRIKTTRTKKTNI